MDLGYMPDFNNELQNLPRDWPLKIFVYERNKLWRFLNLLFQAKIKKILVRSTQLGIPNTSLI